MGRQIHFHMRPEDQAEFLSFVQSSATILFGERDGDLEEIRPVDPNVLTAGKTICLWNRDLLPAVKRKWIADPGYYRIDVLREPILEFLPSFATKWEQAPALAAGRLYGNFDAYLQKPMLFVKWYESLARWIRNHYQRSPETFGSYIGPFALDFQKDGGYLLPSIIPPRTNAWLTKIGKQHEE